MQPRRVIFPDTVPLVHAAITAAVPAGVAVVAKRPARIADGQTVVQYRTDSGPERGFLKDERYGVNCWAPTLREALALLRTVQAHFRSRAATGAPIVTATGGTGPFEVIDEPDEFDNHAHAYCVVELTVRGTNF